MTYIISSGPSRNLDKAGDPEDIQLPSIQPCCSPFQIRFSLSEHVLVRPRDPLHERVELGHKGFLFLSADEELPNHDIGCEPLISDPISSHEKQNPHSRLAGSTTSRFEQISWCSCVGWQDSSP